MPVLLCVVSYNAWNDHVLGWWKHKDDPNVLFLKYEDLHKVMFSYNKYMLFTGWERGPYWEKLCQRS